jgi:glycosyltransferase involved in cell wall biosynthesis
MSSQRRIAILTQTYPPTSGGIAAAHFNLAKCLRIEHAVKVFAFDDGTTEVNEDVERFKTSRVAGAAMEFAARRWVRKYATGQGSTNCERIFRTIPAIRKINRALRRFAPDFILCPDNYVPGLALKKPAHSRLVWIAHHNFRRFEGNPLIGPASWIDLQLAHRLELRALKKADAVVAVSDYMAQVTRDTLDPTCPLHVVRNYVDPGILGEAEPSDLRQRLRLTDSQPIIHLPSAGRPVKGERYTFEIIRRLGHHRRAAFFISGAICPSLDFELRQLDSTFVIHRPGKQDYLQNLTDVAACDFTVSPTLLENLSSALIESLACGLPVVTFDVGGNNELVKTEKNGFLVPYLDIDQMVEAANRLIEDSATLSRLQSAARASIAEILDPDRVLREYDRVFESFPQRDAA